MAPKKQSATQPVASTNTIQVAIEQRAKEVAKQARWQAADEVNSLLKKYGLGSIEHWYDSVTVAMNQFPKATTVVKGDNVWIHNISRDGISYLLEAVHDTAFNREVERLTAEVIAKSVVVLGGGDS